jgi:hypothetical protein
MNRRWRYEGLGALVLDGQGVSLDQPTHDDPQGIVAFVERDARAEGRLSLERGAIRYIRYGWLKTVLDRPHPMARQALLEGANIGVYIHRWTDPMAATETMQALLSADQPPWNMGIRR